MSRSQVALACAGALAIASLLAIACGNRPRGPQTRTFDPGSIVARVGGVRAELNAVRYDERRIVIRLALKNQADDPLEVGAGGMVLAADGLEFPIAPRPDKPLADPIVLASGEAQQLDLAFTTGHRLSEGAVLRVRSMKRGEAWLDMIELEVPPAPEVRAR